MKNNMFIANVYNITMVIQSAQQTLYIPTQRAGVRACGRAGVRACGRAGVRKIEFKRGVLSVRAWSVKRAGVESSTYKLRLLQFC